MLEMNTLAIALLAIGAASLIAALWALQPGHWQTVKDRILLPAFMAMLAFGVPGAILNAYLN